MTRQTAKLFEALDELLDRERQALVAGELNVLADLMVRKETLMRDIGAAGVGEQAGLNRLRDKVNRNHALLNGALEGIRAVAGRMADLRQVRRGLETYDSSGRKTLFDTQARPRVEKRA
ncbi:MAG: flagellar biosynthesis protein FlgN [Rhodobacteraceae bacterium]|nr:flagellar biosynthesis protein FlgN [Paracoccaceae bacterium]